MHRILADELVVEFPIYGGKSRSLKHTFIRAATGGRLARDAADRVVVRALDSINFEFRDGDRVGLVGHNGSGKSTLLRVIARAYEPVSGKIDVSGKVASMLSITLGMDQEATGYENIFLRGAIMGLKPKEIASLVDEICEFSELGDYIYMPLRTYSSGMSVRLAFAISTSMRADVILMDEWLSAGDEDFAAKAQRRLNELVDQAKILVLASHSPEIIWSNCNRILRLEHGSIVEETPGGFGLRKKAVAITSHGEAEKSLQTEKESESPASLDAGKSITLDERQRAWASRGEPSYDENNLVTWAQSVDFMSDARFLAAYDRGMASGHQILGRASGRQDLQIKWRLAIYCWAAHHASRLPGDFVDCGTNTGISSLAVCDYIDFNSTGKSFWLFDTFEGIPIEQISASEKIQGRAEQSLAMFPPCYEIAQRNFAPFPKAHLVKGKIPGTLASAPIKRVAYLCLDMNIAYPERAAIEHFWPLLAPGGIAILDNYGWEPYREQKRTLDEFARQQGVEVMMLPTGQGLLIKS